MQVSLRSKVSRTPLGKVGFTEFWFGTRDKLFFGLILATAVAAWVRFYGLERQSLWLDEYLWTLTGAKSLKEIAYTDDGYPPLYGFLVHFILYVRTGSDWWLRFPSAIAGALSVPLLYLLGLKIQNRTMAIIAAGLLAVHPMAIWYSQEVGAYSLEMLCALSGTLFLLLLMKNATYRWAIGYGISTFLGLGLHYYYLFVVTAHVLIVGFYTIRKLSSLRVGLWVGLFAIGSIGIWGQFLFSDLSSQVARDAVRPSFHWLSLPYTALTFSGGFSFGPPLRSLHRSMYLGQSLWETLGPYTISTFLAIGITFSLALLSCMQLPSRQKSTVLLLTLMPVLGTWLCSAFSIGYRPRYALAALPFAVLWFSSAIHTRFRKTAALLLLGLAAVELYGLAQLNSSLYAREDNRAAVDYIVGKNRNADVLLVGKGTRPFRYYAEGRLKPILYLEPMDLRDDKSFQRAMDHLSGARELWLVSSRSWTVDPHSRVHAFLKTRFQLKEEMRFAGVEVQLYISEEGSAFDHT